MTLRIQVGEAGRLSIVFRYESGARVATVGEGAEVWCLRCPGQHLRSRIVLARDFAHCAVKDACQNSTIIVPIVANLDSNFLACRHHWSRLPAEAKRTASS